MADLSELLLDRAEAKIEFPGADINLVYRPNAYTRELEARMLAIEDNSIPGAEFADACDEVLSELVTEWDVTKRGEPLPVERGVFAANLPIVILLNIVQKLHLTLAGEAGAGRSETAQPTPTNRVERRIAARKK